MWAVKIICESTLCGLSLQKWQLVLYCSLLFTIMIVIGHRKEVQKLYDSIIHGWYTYMCLSPGDHPVKSQ